ncbi:TPA: hypothetical protein RI785_002579 [Vibrio cholerae]|uniref:Uncharacterized protein n=1 Tax=Vibrio cholerae TaxID=666 RepID=A0A5Q6PED0_VIBCL|nr:hypothetical protein [Vibrio cholerae]KAA1253166.1 hypothetical protein F0M16_19210 [Vibrio cholerae]HDV5593859.1 hypothetical protein [Vibrio cholerae]
MNFWKKSNRVMLHLMTILVIFSSVFIYKNSVLISDQALIDGKEPGLNVYVAFLENPDGANIDDLFYPAQSQLDFFENRISDNDASISKMYNVVDIDFNESLVDIKENFEINVQKCTNTFERLSSRAGFTKIESKHNIRIYAHTIDCTDLSLHSYVFMKDTGEGYKVYKTTFTDKNLKSG